MKLSECKVGMSIEDAWYPEWGTGIITKVLKTRIHINFLSSEARLFCKVAPGSNAVIYDIPHLKFLEKR